MSFGRRRKHVFWSLAGLALGFAGLLALYPTYLLSREPEGGLNGIPVGSKQYVFQQKGRCFGSASFTLEFDGSYAVEGMGEIFVQHQGERRKARIVYGSSFNSLGQLTGALVYLGVGELLDLTVKVDQVVPIRVQITGKAGGKEVNWRQRFPGPVEIVENRDGTLRLRYRALPNIQALNRSQALSKFLERIDIEVQSVAPTPKLTCGELPEVPLPLEQFLPLAARVIPEAQAL